MTLSMREIFDKPVDRPIEGVIKADDQASLQVEIEEYVITGEIEKHLERFLDAYVNYTNANGVWISGFFGSGKSHLLKMLALLLENHAIDATTALELFLEKLGDNEILRGDLKRAAAIPSRSILFNIDQKADLISKTQIDALLAVFQKVFDEMCGYFGKQPHIAQFERDLDSRGLYDAFKTAFAELSGKPWERGREQVLLEGRNVAKAYAQVSGDTSVSQDILSQYRTDYRVSIEDFAESVKRYVDTQGPGFRLNFFVDEVGQYIADNIKLMTNLQTLAESLNTRCRGLAWVLVTAQQDMNAVIGDMTQQQAHDFSKIQARFANRMPLSSADVAEVIQRRLLRKTEAGVEVLSDLYHREVNNFKTLFDFSDGSIRLENVRDREHFIHSYPFIPYQYPLFQMAIQELSRHNAFEGRHSSVGERSMLGVFQEVAIKLAQLPVGGIATFDLMFEGIRATLKSGPQQSIQIAQANLGDDFAVQVLKALFLVKYVRQFHASVGNISILMLERFDLDLTAHRRRIEHALNLLEQNTYIQRNGELYEFLTDEERDIEEEIKATDVDTAEIREELDRLVFESVIQKRKLLHEATGNEYPFSRYLDDALVGREHELSIHVITPLNEHTGDLNTIRMRNLGRDELAVVLPPDDRFVLDLMTYKRTDKYIRQTRSVHLRGDAERILATKGEQNAARYRELASRVRTLLGSARLLVRGDEIDLRTEDPFARVTSAFQTLVDKVHINLGMLRGHRFNEAEIGQHLRRAEGSLLGTEGSELTEAEQEVINFARNNERQGLRTTAKAVVERFERKPYGWSYAAILCTLASVLGRGKLEATRDSERLTGDALEQALRNDRTLGNLILQPQVEFSSAQVRGLREFFTDFFDRQPEASDARRLGNQTAEAFRSLRTELERLQEKQASYPFLATLAPLIEQLRSASGKPYEWYLRELPSRADALLDAKEIVLDPIRNFMEGSQRSIYDEATTLLREQDANLGYFGRAEAENIRATLADPACFKGNALRDLKTQVDTLRSEMERRIQQERADARNTVQNLRQQLEGLPEWAGLAEPDRRTVLENVDAALSAIDRNTLIALIREEALRFQNENYPRLLERITTPTVVPTANTTATVSARDAQADPSSSADRATEPPSPQYVASTTLRVRYTKPYLTTEADVDDYLRTLRTRLIDEIQAGRRITV